MPKNRLKKYFAELRRKSRELRHQPETPTQTPPLAPGFVAVPMFLFPGNPAGQLNWQQELYQRALEAARRQIEIDRMFRRDEFE